MPIYEYQCLRCKAHIEAFQKITDKPLTKCSKCGGLLEKQWSNTSFQFKGSGWYVTDYAGKKSDAGEEKKSNASESTPGGGEKAKPADKGETKKKKTEPKTAPSSNNASGD